MDLCTWWLCLPEYSPAVSQKSTCPIATETRAITKASTQMAWHCLLPTAQRVRGDDAKTRNPSFTCKARAYK